MKKQIYENFYLYLCDVVSYYQENGTLKNFSSLAKKWKVKAITKEMFYFHDLHKIKKTEELTREMSDMIRNEMSQADSCKTNKKRFKEGDIVAWRWREDSLRSVAVIENDDWFSICSNFRGRKDEEYRIWYEDSLPGGINIEYATKEDMKQLIKVLVKNREKIC